MMIPLIFGFTLFLILLYFAYPLWLVLQSNQQVHVKETGEIRAVSLVLLIFNGKDYIREKIPFLLNELARFPEYELIVIDDGSTDGSREILQNFEKTPYVRILFKDHQMGIPHSMNLGHQTARFDNLIFCDQRQKLNEGILQRITESLKYSDIAAVSACISCRDASDKHSLLRRHENYLKTLESRPGLLMGVYGPFYAIKRNCYAVIPEHIILDDLYLSLRILKTGRIEMRRDCTILEENNAALFDYARARRYLKGFMQILREDRLLTDLAPRPRLMLLWHKYLRLLIPVFAALSYFCTGILGLSNLFFAWVFAGLTILVLVSVLPLTARLEFRFKNLIRMNIFYFFGLLDIAVSRTARSEKPL